MSKRAPRYILRQMNQFELFTKIDLLTPDDGGLLWQNRDPDTETFLRLSYLPIKI